jgi:hypothetical protein
MKSNQSLEESLVQTVALPDLRDAVVDLAEVGLDELRLEGPARDVPVLGTIVRLVATAGSVRDLVFTRKVVRFLARVSQIPPAERAAFVSENLSDPGKRRRVGEALVLLLDRLDDMQKPDLLGLIFGAYVIGRIDLPTFQRLAAGLDKLNLVWLPMLRLFYSAQSENRPPIPPEALQELAAAGLAGISFGGSGRFHPSMAGGGGFRPNDLGSLFVEITALSTKDADASTKDPQSRQGPRPAS